MSVIRRFVRGMIYGSGEPAPRAVRLKASRGKRSKAYRHFCDSDCAINGGENLFPEGEKLNPSD